VNQSSKLYGGADSASGENLKPHVHESDSISPLPAFSNYNRTNSQSPQLSSPMKQPTASSYLSNTKSNYKSYDKIAQHGSPSKSASRRLQSHT